MSNKTNNKRKVVGAWTLGILILGMLVVFVFQQVTGYTRSSGDNAFSSEYENRLRDDLEKKGLPTSQREARE